MAASAASRTCRCGTATCRRTTTRTDPLVAIAPNTELEPDGTYRIVIAHEDPGIPNWIDTEGRGFGLVFWRFFMPEGDVETPHASVVKLEELRT